MKNLWVARSVGLFCFVASVFGSSRLCAERVDFGGISLTLPEGWAQEDHSRIRTHVRSRSEVADVDGLIGVWSDPRGAESPSQIVLAHHAERLPVTASSRGLVRALVEESVRDGSNVENFELERVEVIEVDGLPAYRLRLRFRSGGVEVHQLLYVLSAGETYLLGLSWTEDREETAAVFDGVVASVAVSHRPGLLQTSSVWLWSGLLCGFLGGGLRHLRCGSILPAPRAPQRR